MARLVRHDADGPIRIDPQEKPVFICGCGLTQRPPFCDGSHKRCAGEEPGTLYEYDADGRRVTDPDAAR
jgi:CDGSH-type Zn-finger protein